MGTKYKDLIIVHDDDGAIHAQELVRCRECKHGMTMPRGIYCEMVVLDRTAYREPDWFCADGEKLES